jgi:hypothetical protein
MGGMSSMGRKKRVCEVGWCIHVCEMLSWVLKELL